MTVLSVTTFFKPDISRTSYWYPLSETDI
jgi:hypothetical protein